MIGEKWVKHINYFSIITIILVKWDQKAQFSFIIENKSKVGRDFPKYAVLQVGGTWPISKGTMVRNIKRGIMWRNLESGACILNK